MRTGFKVKFLALAEHAGQEPFRLLDDHYSLVFDKAGTYTYYDDLNPYTLKGTVVVKQ
jgi:plastocyanin